MVPGLPSDYMEETTGKDGQLVASLILLGQSVTWSIDSLVLAHTLTENLHY